MSRMNKFLLLVAVAVMAAMDMNAQTNEYTSAGEGLIRRRSCRVGTPNPHFAPRRSPMLQNDENPYIGDRHQLVVMASFQDRPFAEAPDSALTTWDRIFNAENFTEDQYVGSVRDYFSAQSYGQFNLKFDLVFVELPDNAKKYRSTSSHDEYSQYMVDDIVDVLQTQDIDWSLYDWDGDAFVDQLLIIYAGEGMNATSQPSTIWPHQWWLSQHLDLETTDPNDYRSYRTITRDDKEYYIDCYCCVQERVNYGGIKTSFGTLCHEFSHCFGFPDFYYGDGIGVVDEWDLMDSGCYMEHGFRPCGYSAHERMLMGWLTPVELTEEACITDMSALCDEPQVYLVRNDGAENEYYLIENRQKLGWDEQLPGSGILVFHVDYDPETWTSGVPNSSYEKRYSIIPANNKTSLNAKAGWAYPYITVDSLGMDVIANDELTNTSKPAAKLNHTNVDGTKLMSKPITQMSVNADGLASFVFMDSTVMSIRELSTNEDEAQGNPRGIPGEGWYLLDGRRLNGIPTTPGLYIHQGKKVFIH